MKLNLNKKKNREIMAVLVKCLLHEKKYNHYYTLLCARLCQLQPDHRFTIKLNLWDHIRIFDNNQLQTYQVIHLSKLAAYLSIKGGLTLTYLKTSRPAFPGIFT